VTHVREALGAYVLGALAPGEAAEVEAHLGRCAACAAERDALAALPGLLALAEEAASHGPPSPAVEERVLDGFARARRPGARRRRPWRLALGAALVGAAAATALAVGLGGDERPAGETAGYGVALRGTRAAPGAWARADLASTAEGTVMHLWARDLVPGRVYAVRCGREAAGSFRADARGRAYVVLTTAARRGQYQWIRVLRRDGAAWRPVLTGRI
jgi:anti-sigma factor RsiW